MIPMDLLADGESGEIAATGIVDAFCASRPEDMGLCVGARVKMLTNGSGAVLVRVADARVIAVEREVAMRIRVRR
jgi:hypothetical protein